MQMRECIMGGGANIGLKVCLIYVFKAHLGGKNVGIRFCMWVGTHYNHGFNMWWQNTKQPQSQQNLVFDNPWLVANNGEQAKSWKKQGAAGHQQSQTVVQCTHRQAHLSRKRLNPIPISPFPEAAYWLPFSHCKLFTNHSSPHLGAQTKTIDLSVYEAFPNTMIVTSFQVVGHHGERKPLPLHSFVWWTSALRPGERERNHRLPPPVCMGEKLGRVGCGTPIGSWSCHVAAFWEESPTHLSPITNVAKCHWH